MQHFSSNDGMIKQLKKFVPTDKIPHTVHHASVRRQQNERLHRHQRRVAKLFENSLATIIESQLEQGNRYSLLYHRNQIIRKRIQHLFNINHDEFQFWNDYSFPISLPPSYTPSTSRPVASSSQSFTPQHQILRETPHVVNVKTRPLIKELPTASRRERSNTLETLVPISTPAKIASPPLIPYTPKWFLTTGSISQSTYDNYIDKSTNIQNSGAWYSTAVPYFINFFQPTNRSPSRLKTEKTQGLPF
ncbi:unnamed protein product [Rhizophagus irregularis]|nr:unnamed protein product [Rhizophagus irregularis]